MKSIVQTILFNKSECEYFKNLLSFEDIKKTNKFANGSFNITVGIIPPSKIPNWFIDKLTNLNISNLKFENEFEKSKSLLINKYDVGGYFERHRDDYALKPDWVKRFKTLIVQLSDESEYDGGDFIVDSILANKTIGNCILFDSSIYHEVLKIDKGSRYSLTLWLERDDINITKSLL
jgi:hypothetical protein